MNRGGLGCAAVAALVLLLCVPTASSAAGPRPTASRAVHADVSPPLRSMRALPPRTPGGRPEVRRRGNPPFSSTPLGADPVQQLEAPSAPSTPTVTSWDGVHNIDFNVPPDTNGDVGPNDYVQWVNVSFQIWSKNGTSRLGPVSGNTLWQGFGGLCETRNEGDPIVIYDRLADRWMFSQFAFGYKGPNPKAPWYQCIAVSQTGDPTGAYYRYAFQMNASTGAFPDYPKFGVWPDGYYMSTNNFSGNLFSGAGAYAFQRSKMLTGDPTAAMISFPSLGTQYEGLLPSHLTGPTAPPAGSPNYFGSVDTDSAGGTGSTFQLWKFHADFATPSNSTFTGPVNTTVAPYTFSFCGVTYSSACIPQPGTSQTLDPLSDRLMNRLDYRNFGDHETLLAAHTVNVGSNRAGMRWYELRSPATTPVVEQQGTFAPTDGISRWMGSVAMDGGGNIALGYSASAASSVFPSVRFTGRLAGDPAGTMTLAEQNMVAGGGSQTGSPRWGDYSAMSIDPVDDTTFWYTQEYYSSTSSSGWKTRIGSFQLAPAAPPPDTTIDSGPSGTTAASYATFTFSSDDASATFECRLDGGSWGGCTSPAEYTGLAEGGHTFEVRAVGSSGTDPTPATRTWTVSAAPYRDAVTATPGLLAYWRLGESSGTTAQDQLFAHAGTYENGVTLGAAGALASDPDTAALFDGVDDDVAVPSLGSSVDLTVEGWERITDASNVNNTLYGRSGTLRLLPRPAGFHAGVWLGGTEYTLGGTTASNVGTWVHWAFVRAATSLTLYRNGVQVASRNDLPGATAATLQGTIGRQLTSYPAKAAIDDVAVYGAALSAATVQGHYLAGV